MCDDAEISDSLHGKTYIILDCLVDDPFALLGASAHPINDLIHDFLSIHQYVKGDKNETSIEQTLQFVKNINNITAIPILAFHKHEQTYLRKARHKYYT